MFTDGQQTLSLELSWDGHHLAWGSPTRALSVLDSEIRLGKPLSFELPGPHLKQPAVPGLLTELICLTGPVFQEQSSAGNFASREGSLLSHHSGIPQGGDLEP